jgi:hypothetical protein
VVGQVGVVVAPIVCARVDVHCHGAQSGHRVEHVVPRSLGDLMRLPQRQVGVGDDQRFGVDGVTDPARAHD